MEEIVKIQTDSEGLGGSLRVCPSNNFLGDVNAAGVQTTLSTMTSQSWALRLCWEVTKRAAGSPEKGMASALLKVVG